MNFLERTICIRDDIYPKEVDTIIGIGIDLSKDGNKASPYSTAVAMKCLELLKSDTSKNLILSGGYCLKNKNEAQAMLEIIQKVIPKEKKYI